MPENEEITPADDTPAETTPEKYSSADTTSEEATPEDTSHVEAEEKNGAEDEADPEDPYQEAVYRSFLEKSVRSALLIDDQFPMFDTAEGELGKDEDRERAKRLYRTFKNRTIICDIESRPSELKDPSKTDRLLKSDLVVLDYHLDKEEHNNPKKAMAILKRLAESKHFNVVALYTSIKEPELWDVWLDVTATLKGGWKSPDDMLDGGLLDKWNELNDGDNLPDFTKELLASFLENGSDKTLKDEGRELVQQFRAEADVNKSSAKKLVNVLISRGFRERIGDYKIFDEEHCNQITCSGSGQYWVQSGNLFVAIMTKIEPEAEDVDKPDPERIWERLTAAVKDWRPNLLQIMMSEIQNILEVEGVTIDPEYAGSPELQAGILFTLFQAIPQGDGENMEGFFHPAIEDLTWKLVESIRRKISTNPGLLEMVEQIVNWEVSKDAWKQLPDNEKTRSKEILDFIKKELINGQSTDNNDIFFELNTFLSSDTFRGSHLTTGAIFKQEDDNKWWLCCSPACDMEPRKPRSWRKSGDSWHQENHPTKKIMALRLEPCSSHKKGLTTVHEGRRIFIKNGDSPYLFRVLNDHNHPNWEVLLLEQSDTPLSEECDQKNKKFQAYLVGSNAEGSCKIDRKDFCVVAQLRPEYASRILQYTGFYLSRIGVDYVNMPSS